MVRFSVFALIIRYPTLRSLAHRGTRPQRIIRASRRPSVASSGSGEERTVSTSWVGATLKRSSPRAACFARSLLGGGAFPAEFRSSERSSST